MQNNLRIFAAEVIGTTFLVLGGPGSAIIASDKIGTLGVAIAFGLSLLVMVYAIGHITGCHINPAVTLGAVLARRIPTSSAPFYFVGQFIGALIAGMLLLLIASGNDTTGHWASNGWGSTIGSNYGLGPTIVVEILFTALFVFVILLVTSKMATPGVAGVAIGLTLTLIHLVTIPVDNTSVNPARSFASALLEGTEAWKQYWVFLIFPLVGGVVGVLLWLVLAAERLEDTMLDLPAMRRIRDAVTSRSESTPERFEES